MMFFGAVLWFDIFMINIYIVYKFLIVVVLLLFLIVFMIFSTWIVELLYCYAFRKICNVRHFFFIIFMSFNLMYYIF